MQEEKAHSYSQNATIYKQCVSIDYKQYYFMKTLSIICFTLFLSAVSFGQQIDKRLLTKYNSEELELMKVSNPEKIGLLVYALDNAIYIIDIPKEKRPELVSIKQPQAGETFLDLGIEIKETNQYFRIEGTDKMLVMKSEWVLNHEINAKK